jgi:hypothetical protein
VSARFVQIVLQKLDHWFKLDEEMALARYAKYRADEAAVQRTGRLSPPFPSVRKAPRWRIV